LAAVQSVLAALTDADLTGGGRGARPWARRVELRRELAQPSLALLGRDAHGCSTLLRYLLVSGETIRQWIPEQCQQWR
jgi:hypothetical protein